MAAIDLFDTGYNMPSIVSGAPTDQGSGFFGAISDRLLRAADYWIEGQFGPAPVAQPNYLTDSYTYTPWAVQPAAFGADAAYSAKPEDQSWLLIAAAVAALGVVLVLVNK